MLPKVLALTAPLALLAFVGVATGAVLGIVNERRIFAKEARRRQARPRFARVRPPET